MRTRDKSHVLPTQLDILSYHKVLDKTSNMYFLIYVNRRTTIMLPTLDQQPGSESLDMEVLAGDIARASTSTLRPGDFGS